MSDIPQVQVADVPDDTTILDVREPDEWQAGRAPNALHIPLGDLPARLGELPDPDEGSLAVTCRSGGRSSRAVAWLVQQGFEVENLDGGMKAWAGADKPLVADGGRTPEII